MFLKIRCFDCLSASALGWMREVRFGGRHSRVSCPGPEPLDFWLATAVSCFSKGGIKPV